MAAYSQAVGLAPEWAEGHGRLAELLEATGDVEGAIESFRRAAAAAPETPAGRLNAVRALTLEGKYREAEAQLRQAIVLDPASDLLHKALGDALSKQGRFEEAIEACDRALAINPLQVPAHLIAVQARKCTQADRPRLGRMLSALGEASLDDEDRLFLHYAIGKMLDDLGEYREAMQHFDQANGIRRRNASFDRELFSGHVDWVIRRFTPAFFTAHADFAVDDETPLLIVGMPRSGTTLVEQILSSHPQIAGGGELVFWTRRAASWGVSSASYLTPASARDLAGDYLAMLRRIGPSAARVTDKVPFNLFQLGLIHLLLPKARIIHCRRHPIDTCLSMYFTNFKEKFEFVSDKGDLAFAYRQYARLMDHWRAVLPSDRFVEVDYESLIADRQTLTRRLIAFTGLDWHDACLAPERNERTVITSSFWQVRQPVYVTSIARWRNYEPWLGELRQFLPADEDATGAG
jgi:tetratricopeptide (TPR) repeat protein